MPVTKTFSIALTVAILALACADDNADELAGAPPGNTSPTPTDQPPGPRGPPTCAELQTSYVGIAGIKLESTRTDYEVGTEHTRNKPFEALQDDYKRLFGAEPGSLAASGPTFGQAPSRWYIEPSPNAVSLYQAYRVAFEACLVETKTDPKWAVAPTATTAKAQCAEWQRSYWSRTPPSESIAACASVAETASLVEATPGGADKPTDPRRRWAYACASVLTAGEFIMY